MPVDISLEVEGLEEVEQKFRQAPQIVTQETRDGMGRIVQKLTGEVKTRTPVDTGRLRSSIMNRVEGRGAGVQGIVSSNVKYAPFVELDTQPHFPPLSALEPWARRHGKTAWGVALAIAAHGTKGRHMFERALKDNIGWIESEFQRIGKRIAERLGGS